MNGQVGGWVERGVFGQRPDFEVSDHEVFCPGGRGGGGAEICTDPDTTRDSTAVGRETCLLVVSRTVVLYVHFPLWEAFG